MKTLVILGAGPAGAATALGLRRLGYPVTLVSEWRRFAALEGVSLRVLEALRGAGLEQALTAPIKTPRSKCRLRGITKEGGLTTSLRGKYRWSLFRASR